jgi:hypothetical protein
MTSDKPSAKSRLFIVEWSNPCNTNMIPTEMKMVRKRGARNVRRKLRSFLPNARGLGPCMHVSAYVAAKRCGLRLRATR